MYLRRQDTSPDDDHGLAATSAQPLWACYRGDWTGWREFENQQFEQRNQTLAVGMQNEFLHASQESFIAASKVPKGVVTDPF